MAANGAGKIILHHFAKCAEASLARAFDTEEFHENCLRNSACRDWYFDCTATKQLEQGIEQYQTRVESAN
ncbi:MAG: hypothetical protein ACJARP_002752 [Vicingaceae bacterium]